MAQKKPKIVRPSSVVPSGLKEPKAAFDPDSNLNRKAAWRVHRIHMADPYGWHELNVGSVLDIKEKLSHFESMTWNDIFTIGRTRNHKILVEKLRCPKAKHWMKENMPDQDSLWTLRLSGAERIWGIFSDGVYQIIFWDPKHLIYPVQH